MDGMEACLASTHKFLKLTQMKGNPPDYKKYFRQATDVSHSFSIFSNHINI